jgi:hypothetical protein
MIYNGLYFPVPKNALSIVVTGKQGLLLFQNVRLVGGRYR